MPITKSPVGTLIWRKNLPVTLLLAGVMIAGLTYLAGLLWPLLVWSGIIGALALAGERFGRWWRLPAWVLPLTLAIGVTILVSALLASVGQIVAIACLGAAGMLYFLDHFKK
jgi:hypothetical protein